MSQAGKTGEIKRELVTETIRVVLALLVLGVIQFLIGYLPGASQVVLSPEITAGTLLYAVVTLVMFAAVLNFAVSVGDLLSRRYTGFTDAEDIVRLTGLLVVIIWAFQVFWWLPYFRTHPTQYQFVFLIAAVGVGGWLAYLVYSNIDAISEAMSDQLVSTEGAAAFTEQSREHESEPTAGVQADRESGASTDTRREEF